MPVSVLSPGVIPRFRIITPVVVILLEFNDLVKAHAELVGDAERVIYDVPDLLVDRALDVNAVCMRLFEQYRAGQLADLLDQLVKIRRRVAAVVIL